MKEDMSQLERDLWSSHLRWINLNFSSLILQIMKKTLITLWTTLLISMFSTTEAVNASVIKWKYGSNPDIPNSTTHIEWSRSILDIISLVNSYLRFAIWLVCFLFMIWNGYQLIMARWNDKQMKEATDAIVGCVVWLAVCLLAYIIVNLAIKLFS